MGVSVWVGVGECMCACGARIVQPFLSCFLFLECFVFVELRLELQNKPTIAVHDDLLC